MKRLLGTIIALALSAGAAFAQALPQTPAGNVLGNSTAATRNARPETVTAILDRALGSTRGGIIERGASGWALVGPGTTGKPWVSNGAGADPAYQTLGIAGGGTNCAAASGTCLDNITGFASTGLISRTGAGTYSFTTPSALTKTDDTNVTMTLGGTPATALLQAASLTLGWTGTLAIGRGGTGAATQAAAAIALLPTPTRAGDVLYWNGTNWVTLAGNNSGARLLQEDASGVPSWVSAGAGSVSIPGSGLVSGTATSCDQTANQSTLHVANCINAQTGTSYAIADSDRHKLVTASNAAAQAYTIAQAGTASAFANGWCTEIYNKSTTVAGVVTITPTTSTIDGAATLRLAQGQKAKICSDGTNYNVAQISGIRSVSKQSFTANGTYTPSVGLIVAQIECVGAGGAGGGTAGATTTSVGAGGGGGGGYARVLSTAATIGASQTVTIGTGGTAGTAGNVAGNAGSDTSVGSLCIGKGGSGGGGANGASGGSGGASGAGGVAGTGDFTFPGVNGGWGPATGTTNGVFGGMGGSTYFGGGSGAPSICASSAVAGAAGKNYGGGGSGSCASNSATNVSGGAGANGAVYITEYLAQ